MGKKTGAFETTVSDDLANFEKDKLAGFDAVVFNNTTQNVFLPDKKEFEAMDEAGKAAAKDRESRLRMNLLEFIHAGKGFVGIHAATDTLYEWPEYGKMIGGYFDGHPWTAGHDVSIKVEKPDILSTRPCRTPPTLNSRRNATSSRPPTTPAARMSCCASTRIKPT